MTSSSLWILLHALPKSALRDLEKMVASPYFNRRADVAALFEEMNRHLRLKKPPEQELIFEKLYPGRSFEASRLRQVMHLLTMLIREYLVRGELRESGQFQVWLAKACNDLGLSEQARRALREADDHLEAATVRDSDWHERRFRVQAEEFRQPAADAVRNRRLHLQDLSDSLEKSFVLQKLKLTCGQLSHQAVFPADYDLGLLQPVLEMLEKRPDWLQSPEIGVYYHGCKALLHPEDERHFWAIKPLLMHSPTVFSAQENHDLFLLGVNYCIRKLNEGNMAYAHEGIALYKHALENDYLLEKGELSRFTFRNIVGMGLKIKAFDWVEWFIHTYKDRISRSHRESTVSFNLARLEYGRRNYGQAIALLQKADYDDLLLHLAAKTLLLKIYYEAGELRLLESLLEAFQIFIRRKKIIGYHQTNYRNVARHFQKLLSLNRFDAEEVTAFRGAVEADEHLTERDWFLEQVDNAIRV